MSENNSQEKNTIGRYVDTYKHVDKINPDTRDRGKLGGLFRKGIIGWKASGALASIEAKQSKVTLAVARAQEALDAGRITRAEYDQKCAVAKKELVEVKRKHGYLTDEQALEELDRIKKAHPLEYSGTVIRR